MSRFILANSAAISKSLSEKAKKSIKHLHSNFTIFTLEVIEVNLVCVLRLSVGKLGA
jgi:hypothetical protein